MTTIEHTLLCVVVGMHLSACGSGKFVGYTQASVEEEAPSPEVPEKDQDLIDEINGLDAAVKSPKKSIKIERATVQEQEELEPISFEIELESEPLEEVVLEIPHEGVIQVEGGIEQGHFDLDTFDFEGYRLKHVHEYDDKYNTNGYIFWGESNGSSVQDENQFYLQQGQEFYVRVLNFEANKDALITINNEQIRYDDASSHSLDYTTLASYSADSLFYLAVSFPLDALNRDGIRGTEPKKVEHNEAGPGGSYRNGALTVQLIDVDSESVLVEGSLYWHVKSNKEKKKKKK